MLQPKMFLAENIKGLTTHDGGRTIQTMLDVFEDLGYTVEWKVLNAWDYGVAEKRQRVVLCVAKEQELQEEFQKNGL